VNQSNESSQLDGLSPELVEDFLKQVNKRGKYNRATHLTDSEKKLIDIIQKEDSMHIDDIILEYAKKFNVVLVKASTAHKLRRLIGLGHLFKATRRGFYTAYETVEE
jgi:predicted glutamine amidotransferase